jgi:hypothetical protein
MPSSRKKRHNEPPPGKLGGIVEFKRTKVVDATDHFWYSAKQLKSGSGF